MNPALSVVVFTVVAGMAQGLVVALALAVLGEASIGVESRPGAWVSPLFVDRGLLVAAALASAGLASSFLHLGRPGRAWRAASMWRTSWLSREVIALPAFIGTLVLWWLALHFAASPLWTGAIFPLGALALCVVLWRCTAMIYACLRFIEEWAHPLTFVNFTLSGLASGSVLAAALAAVAGEAAFMQAAGLASIALLVAALVGRLLALRRNGRIRHRSNLQSATGIQAERLVQTSMGMSAGSFNTREFFHHASTLLLRNVRLAGVGLGFVGPLLLAAVAAGSGSAWLWSLAVAVQAIGLVADRWTFFAQAKHPQNLYYQVVS